MSRVLSIAFVAALALCGTALAQPHNGAGPPPPGTRFSDAQRADLKRVEAYLDSMKSVQGSFLQISGTGRSERGTFYIRKPGRVRFEYQKPNPTLVISDGSTVAVENMELHTTDRYPLANSPLRLLLSSDPDLGNDSRITSVKKEPGALQVTAAETSGPAQGSITLIFADTGANTGANGGLELRQWDVMDAQGQRTTVVVNEMHQVADLPAKLFIIEDLSPFQKKNG
jgi:outer membrane lipoprotein-sorting protein